MIYTLTGSIVSVGKLTKYTKVIGYKPIIPKQVNTYIGSKKSHQPGYMDTKSNHKIINRSIILRDQQVEIMVTVILGIVW